MALGAMLKASAAQQALQGDGEVSFLAAARAAKARQEAAKMNKDTVAKIKKAIDVAKKLKKLDLADMGLTEIPPEVWELTDLKIMWLQGNNLTEIPSDISKLEQLNQIRLFDNQITSLPAELGLLSNLSVFWAQNNLITEIPEELGNCTLLSVLSLSENKITKLPFSLGQCTSLRELMIEHCPLEVPPQWVQDKGMRETIKYLRRLFVAQKDHILDLRGLGLTEIPEECLDIEDVEELKLSDNLLKSLPDEVGAWADTIEKITLSNNKLLRMPEILQNFVQLRELHAGGNEIMDLPIWISKLKDLKVIKVPSNKLRRLPLALAHLPRLEELDASGNPIVSPPQEVVDGGAPSVQAYLNKFIYAQKTKILNFNKLKLTELPSEIWHVPYITKLMLNENQIKQLPEDCYNLTALTHLELNSNGFKEFPNMLGDMTRLECLMMSGNKIDRIPESIADVIFLKTLHLDNNGIKDIPFDSLGGLTNLTELSLQKNKIKYIPDDFSKMSMLKRLNLDENVRLTAPPLLSSPPPSYPPSSVFLPLHLGTCNICRVAPLCASSTHTYTPHTRRKRSQMHTKVHTVHAGASYLSAPARCLTAPFLFR